MRERIQETVFGFRTEVVRGPREWLGRVVETINEARHKVQMVLGDEELQVLEMALKGKEIPETWEEVTESMGKERPVGEKN
jgi:hypothetical protein